MENILRVNVTVKFKHCITRSRDCSLFRRVQPKALSAVHIDFTIFVECQLPLVGSWSTGIWIVHHI